MSKPYYSKQKKCWVVEVEGRVEEGSLDYIVSEYVHGGLFFPFFIGAQRCHEHRFEDVLKRLLVEPEGFSLEGVEVFYSAQERELLEQLRKKLLEEEV